MLCGFFSTTFNSKFFYHIFFYEVAVRLNEYYSFLVRVIFYPINEYGNHRIYREWTKKYEKMINLIDFTMKYV